MVKHRVPIEQQKTLWLDFYQQLPSIEWAEQCMQQAERIERLLERQRLLTGTPQPMAPLPDHALKQFVWQGDRYGITHADLRERIVNLSKYGMISSDVSQREAMRRGLGMCVNETERTSTFPWVVWLSDSDVLTFLIEGLWSMNLIYCVGGQHQKWNTLCGIFLHADGSRFRPSIKSSRCKSKEKMLLLHNTFLGGLHSLSSQPLPYDPRALKD